MSKNILMEHTMFHNDDVKLTLEYPEDLTNTTDLSEKVMRERYLVFARILFDTLMTKEKKDFKISYDEETKEWVYLLPQTNK